MLLGYFQIICHIIVFFLRGRVHEWRHEFCDDSIWSFEKVTHDEGFNKISKKCVTSFMEKTLLSFVSISRNYCWTIKFWNSKLDIGKLKYVFDIKKVQFESLTLELFKEVFMEVLVANMMTGILNWSRKWISGIW